MLSDNPGFLAGFIDFLWQLKGIFIASLTWTVKLIAQ